MRLLDLVGSKWWRAGIFAMVAVFIAPWNVSLGLTLMVIGLFCIGHPTEDATNAD